MTPESFERAKAIASANEKIEQGLAFWKILNEPKKVRTVRDGSHYVLPNVHGISDENFKFFRQMAIENLNQQLADLEAEFAEL